WPLSPVAATNSLWPLLVITATTGSAAYAMFRRKVM
ncbi:hypothetical protein, partial [Escherichia coli]